eukprot:jgi/Tetstr1/463294/TSEL_008218.t1
MTMDRRSAMRRGIVPPWVAAVVGAVSGYYIFNEPLRRHAEEAAAARRAEAAAAAGGDDGKTKPAAEK